MKGFDKSYTWFATYWYWDVEQN